MALIAFVISRHTSIYANDLIVAPQVSELQVQRFGRRILQCIIIPFFRLIQDCADACMNKAIEPSHTIALFVRIQLASSYHDFCSVQPQVHQTAHISNTYIRYILTSVSLCPRISSTACSFSTPTTILNLLRIVDLSDSITSYYISFYHFMRYIGKNRSLRFMNFN